MAKVLSLDTSNNVVEITVSGGGGGMLYRKQQVFTTSGTFTLPATALPSVGYDIIGGGGAGQGCGGGASNKNGGGGGGGDRKRGIVELVPGETYEVVIGSGGIGIASDSTPAASGGASSFAGIVASGGSGANSNFGGLSGSGLYPPPTFYSALSCAGAGTAAVPGGYGYDSKCSGGGYGGSNSNNAISGYGGPGAGKGNSTINGGNATSAGCGGGGAGRQVTPAIPLKGGDGFRGEVTVTYWDTVP